MDTELNSVNEDLLGKIATQLGVERGAKDILLAYLSRGEDVYNVKALVQSVEIDVDSGSFNSLDYESQYDDLAARLDGEELDRETSDRDVLAYSVSDAIDQMKLETEPVDVLAVCSEALIDSSYSEEELEEDLRTILNSGS